MTTPVVYCTVEAPYGTAPMPLGARVIHVNAAQVGDQEDGWPGGDLVTYRCPHCGASWKEELPQ
jgi:hypothetical protein